MPVTPKKQTCLQLVLNAGYESKQRVLRGHIQQRRWLSALIQWTECLSPPVLEPDHITTPLTGAFHRLWEAAYEVAGHLPHEYVFSMLSKWIEILYERELPEGQLRARVNRIV